jgi:hypothetical protein
MEAFFDMLAWRTLLHFIGGFIIGFVSAGFTRWLIIAVVLGVLTIKEFFIDPHPSDLYWVKSIMDIGVWSIAMALGYFGYMYCKGDNNERTVK